MIHQDDSGGMIRECDCDDWYTPSNTIKHLGSPLFQPNALLMSHRHMPSNPFIPLKRNFIDNADDDVSSLTKFVEEVSKYLNEVERRKLIGPLWSTSICWTVIKPCSNVCLFANVWGKGAVEVASAYVAGRKGKAPILR